MYRRDIDGKVYDLDHCGYVYKGSFMMFDRQTGSEWIHVTAECVMGPLKGKSLDFVPASVITWREWKSQHPETTVFPSRRRWKEESRSRKDFAETSKREKLGLNVLVQQKSKLYPYNKLEAKKVINDRFGETPLAVVFVPKADAALAWVRELDGKPLTFEPLAGYEKLRLKDRETGSTWDPLSGRCVAGPSQGKQLKPLVAIAIRLRRYRAFYPKGETFKEE